MCRRRTRVDLELQACAYLNGLAAEQLGTKWVGPKATPMMTSTMRMAVQHKEVYDEIMRTTCTDPAATNDARAAARAQFFAASRSVTKTAARARATRELALFRQVEECQGDCKLFWSKFKHLRTSITVSKSPPPVATDAKGVTVSDPTEVLKAWRDYCAAIASADLSGTQEEGRYDDRDEY